MTTMVAVIVAVVVVRALVLAARRLEAGQPARRLATARRWRVPREIRERMERALHDAAINLEPEAACELWLAGVAACAIVGTALSPVLGMLAGLGALVGGPMTVHLARDRARRQVVAGLPGALEQIAAGLRGGATVNEAIGAVADGGGSLARDLATVRARATLGPGLPGALALWSSERDLVSVGAACGALTVASSVGGPAAAAVDGLAGSLRDRLGAVAEARALSAQARMSAIVVGAAPIAYLAFSAVADPKSLGLLVATGAGRVCLVLGLALEVAGVLLLRSIVRAEQAE